MMLTYREITVERDLTACEKFLDAHPHASLWQSSIWKEYEERCGRTVRRFAGWRDTTICMAAQVSVDRTVMHISTWTIQRGPLWDASVSADDLAAFLAFLQNEAKKDGAMSLFLSPAVWNPLVDLPGRASHRHIVPEATTVIDLTQSEEGIIKAMHPKGRYNIGVAKRDGVMVEESRDIDAFYELLKKTSDRDGFGVKRKMEYEAFLKIPGNFLLLATADSSQLTAHSRSMPIAALLGIVWGTQGMYYYGASDYASRALMAPYLLQWTAMQRAKAAGCISYDFLGIAPPSAPANDPWQGITDFKKKFGGIVLEYPPEREIVLRPVARMIVRMKRRLFG